MTYGWFTGVVCGVVLLGVSLPVGAQQAPPTRPERPYRGLFGGGASQAPQTLIFGASLGMGLSRGDEPIATDTDEDEPDVSLGGREDVSRTFGSFSGTLAYTLSIPRITVTASANTAARLYLDGSDDVLTGHTGNVAMSADLSSRTRLTANQRVAYEPTYGLALFPDALGLGGQTQAPVDFDLGARRDAYLTRSGNVMFSHEILRRLSASLTHSYEAADLDDGDLDQQTTSGGLAFTQPITRNLGVRLGYTYSVGRYGQGDEQRTFRTQSGDIGLGFNRALSLTRRTSLSFNTGTSAMSSENETRFELVGGATLSHEIGRSWHAALAYSRDVGFFDRLRLPTFSDSLSAQVTGLLGRRVSLRSGVRAAIGDVGLDNPDAFTSYNSSAGVTIGLSRFFGIAADYIYYSYDFDQGTALPEGVGRRVSRQSVFASLTVSVPLVQQRRRANASR